MKDVKIDTEFIKLDQLLKMTNMCSSGGEAKVRIISGDVKVNGEVEERRGKKLRIGDVVAIDGKEFRIV